MALSRKAIEDLVGAVLGTGRSRSPMESGPLRALGAEAYQRVGHQSAVAMFIVGLDGGFVDANPAACRLFGRTEPELLECTLGDISHPDDLAWSRDLLRDALAHDTASYRISKRYLRGDGSVVFADVTVTLLHHEGEPLGFFATAIDDTERLESARKADEAARLLRDAMDSLLDPWVLLRPVRDPAGAVADFVFIEANREACRHNSRTREELVGARLLELLPDHRGDLLARYAHVVDTGEPLVLDDHPFLTDGEQRWFDNRAVRVGDQDLSFTWRDVTEAHLQRGELARRAATDPLTGLYNRSGLAAAIARLERPDRRSASGIGVLYLDVDGLTTINNTDGHPAGDAVLRAVADRVAGALRSGDIVARVGGDEFVVVATGIDRAGADDLAGKLTAAVTRPVRLGETAIVPTISIGVALGSDRASVDDLIALADAQLLERKRELYRRP